MPAATDSDPTPKKRSVHFDESAIDKSNDTESRPKKQSKGHHHHSTAFVSSLTKAHPLGVRPSGNALLCGDDAKSNPLKTLGPLFGRLPEPLLMTVLQDVEDPKDLLHLGHTCKVMFAYAWNDELWKHMVYRFKRQPEKWYGSWRRTYLEMTEQDNNEEDANPSDEATVDCKGLIFSDLLYRPFQCSQIDYKKILMRALQDDMEEEEEMQLAAKHKHPATRAQLETASKLIPIMTESDMTLSKYNAEWHSKPFMLNLDSPIAKWTVEELVERFGDTVFRQEYMDWKLKVYYEYMQNNRDESPLYLFDCRSEAMRPRKKTPSTDPNTKAEDTPENTKKEYYGGELSKEYRLPGSAFTGDSNDVFTVFGNVRPDCRWLILGPGRSGSSFHKDPNATTAWNVVLTGHKYWVMFPSASSSSSTQSHGLSLSSTASSTVSTPPGISTDSEESEVTAPVSIAEWFASGYYDVARQTPGFCHGICGPNQMMHVPSGWWHLVVNLDECLALTGNFVPVVKVPDVMDFLLNKPGQISGFKFKAVEKELSRNYASEFSSFNSAITPSSVSPSPSSNNETPELSNDQDEDDEGYGQEDEDEDDATFTNNTNSGTANSSNSAGYGGSCDKNADVSQYIFHLFVSKILQSGNPQFIDSLRRSFARLPLLMLFREKERLKQEQDQNEAELKQEQDEKEKERVSKKWQALMAGTFTATTAATTTKETSVADENGGGVNSENGGENVSKSSSGFSFGFAIGDDDIDQDMEIP